MSSSITYTAVLDVRYLHEGLNVLADRTPDLSTVRERTAAAGYTYVNLDGTVIHTDSVAAVGPNGADP